MAQKLISEEDRVRIALHEGTSQGVATVLLGIGWLIKTVFHLSTPTMIFLGVTLLLGVITYRCIQYWDKYPNLVFPGSFAMVGAFYFFLLATVGPERLDQLYVYLNQIALPPGLS